MSLGLDDFFFQFSWQVPTYKIVAISGINLEKKIEQKKLRNISCMFLSIAANKLSLKQTGRHSEVLVKQEAREHEKPHKECWNTLKRRNHLLLFSLSHSSMWTASKEREVPSETHFLMCNRKLSVPKQRDGCPCLWLIRLWVLGGYLYIQGLLRTAEERIEKVQKNKILKTKRLKGPLLILISNIRIRENWKEFPRLLSSPSRATEITSFNLHNCSP